VQNLFGNEYTYAGTMPPTRLKVAGIDLLSAGELGSAQDGWRDVRIDDGDTVRDTLDPRLRGR
jgi:NAD(P)H-nitrite reductase large subunit